MVRKTLFFFWLVSLILGFVFASYGVLRESFSALAQQQGTGEGRSDESSTGEGLSKTEASLFSFGLKAGLLRSDRSLTMTDRKKNAAWAVAGVILVGLSIVFGLGLKFTSSRARDSGKYILPWGS